MKKGYRKKDTEKSIGGLFFTGFKYFYQPNLILGNGYQTLQLQENHKDPFDRFIIATALCEDMKIISSDAKFDYYLKVDRIWED